MNILVAYASFTGSTREVAKYIAAIQRKHRHCVHIAPIKFVNRVDEFDAIILGSPIRFGRPHQDLLSFINRYQQALLSKATALFIVCLTMKEDLPDNRRMVDNYLKVISDRYPDFQPLAIEYFSGTLFLDRLNFINKAFLDRSRKQRGDFRDWGRIRAWSEKLPELFVSSFAATPS